MKNLIGIYWISYRCLHRGTFTLTMRRLLFLLLTLSIIPPVHSVAIYTYTGNNFTDIFQDATGIYSNFNFVTATLQVNDAIVQTPGTTVDAALLPGFSLSMSDGTRTLSPSDTTFLALFEFGAGGSLVGWDVRKHGVSASDFIETRNSTMATWVREQSAQFGSDGIQAQAWVTDNPGSWTGFSTDFSRVPAPATLALIGLGLAVVGFSRRR